MIGALTFTVWVKFVTPDSQRIISSIDFEVKFQYMWHIYYMFNSVVIDIIVDSNEGAVGIPLNSSFLS